MTIRLIATMTAAGLLVHTGSVAAQSPQSAITFTVPVNLTQLSPDIAKVSVTCSIGSSAIPNDLQGNAVRLQKTMEFPVSGGQLVTTATVVVAVPPLDNPVGKSATYDCDIMGFSTLRQQWHNFDTAFDISGLYMFVVSPKPSRITGSFVW
jgi:hypothetical protein